MNPARNANAVRHGDFKYYRGAQGKQHDFQTANNLSIVFLFRI
jgi:hypothetical protein